MRILVRLAVIGLLLFGTFLFSYEAEKTVTTKKQQPTHPNQHSPTAPRLQPSNYTITSCFTLPQSSTMQRQTLPMAVGKKSSTRQTVGKLNRTSFLAQHVTLFGQISKQLPIKKWSCRIGLVCLTTL